jgi:DMSO/TMAO reductase YedYZ molybdopterin-dependent catalytic subunit
MKELDIKSRSTPFLHKKPSSLRYFQEGPAPIDLSTWRLNVEGEVKNQLSLELDALKNMPAAYHHRRTVCVCLWTIKRHWYGLLLRDVLDAAGVELDNDELFLKQRSNGTDKGYYETTIHMKSALDRNAILAWQADDVPLTLETGFPLRLIDFGLFNYKCVKALQSIEVTRENKLGHWEAHSGYDLDGTVQPKKYYAVDLQRKVWFGGTGEVIDGDL